MLSIPSTLAIYVRTSATDIRKGIDGLSGIVRQEFQGDPLDGSLYLFVNRRRDRLKILYWDGTGYWIFYKVLAAGTFEMLSADGPRVQIDTAQLAMLLSGISVHQATRRKRYRHAS